MSMSPILLKPVQNGIAPFTLLHFDGYTAAGYGYLQDLGTGATGDWSSDGSLDTSAGKKFGAASAYLGTDGVTGGCAYPSGVPLPNCYSPSHTIEAWVKIPSDPASADAYCGIFHFCNAEGNATTGQNLYYDGAQTNGMGTVIHFNDGATVAAYGSAAPPYDTWFHVAGVQTPTQKKLFINGTLVSTATQAAPTVFVTWPVIGGYGDGYQAVYPGGPIYIDELRITKAALYSNNFTPPTAAFPYLAVPK